LNRQRSWRELFGAGAVLSAALLVAFLTLPVAALVLGSLSELGTGLGHPLVLPALELTLFTTSISLLAILGLGTPLAWLLARRSGRWVRVVETLVELPVVIPPAVAGLSLLLAFGRHGVLAGVLYPEGASLAFSTLSVILAETFVAAPFYVQAAVSTFRALDPELLVVARTLGAQPWRVFFRIALPLGAPGLVAGAALSWARALGEFGATLMFAGNLPGRTTTLPLAIYTALESDLAAARALAVILVIFSFSLLLVMRLSLSYRARAGLGDVR
jgi:molybdate transport system permease protein